MKTHHDPFYGAYVITGLLAPLFVVVKLSFLLKVLDVKKFDELTFLYITLDPSYWSKKAEYLLSSTPDNFEEAIVDYMMKLGYLQNCCSPNKMARIYFNGTMKVIVG